MSNRLSLLAILLVFYLIFLLSNMSVVSVQFFMVQVNVPLFYIIALSTLAGAVISFLFASMFRSDRKIREKIRKLRDSLSAQN